MSGLSAITSGNDNIKYRGCYEKLYQFLFPLVALKTLRDQPLNVSFQDMEVRQPDPGFKMRIPPNKVIYKGYPGASKDNQLGYIVRPNFDTAYDTIYADLLSTPIIITVPPIPDIPGKHTADGLPRKRFWNMQMMDAWTSNFVEIGLQNNAKPGKYCLQGYTRNQKYGPVYNNLSPGSIIGVLVLVLWILLVAAVYFGSAPTAATTSIMSLVVGLAFLAILLVAVYGPKQYKACFVCPTDYSQIIIRLEAVNLDDYNECVYDLQRKFRVDLLYPNKAPEIMERFNTELFVPAESYIVDPCKTNSDCDMDMYCDTTAGYCKPYSRDCQFSDECSPIDYCDTTTHMCAPFPNCEEDSDCSAGMFCDYTLGGPPMPRAPGQSPIHGVTGVCRESNAGIASKDNLCSEDFDCPYTNYCDEAVGQCKPRPCFNDLGCPSDQACSPDMICVGRIDNRCRSNMDCMGGQYCDPNSGYCEDQKVKCETSDECGTGKSCDPNSKTCKTACSNSLMCKTKKGEYCDTTNGVCVDGMMTCEVNNDCIDGYSCMDGVCKVTPQVCSGGPPQSSNDPNPYPSGFGPVPSFPNGTPAPMESPMASPMASQRASPMASQRASPMASQRASQRASPMASQRGSPMASQVMPATSFIPSMYGTWAGTFNGSKGQVAFTLVIADNAMGIPTYTIKYRLKSSGSDTFGPETKSQAIPFTMDDDNYLRGAMCQVSTSSCSLFNAQVASDFADVNALVKSLIPQWNGSQNLIWFGNQDNNPLPVNVPLNQMESFSPVPNDGKCAMGYSCQNGACVEIPCTPGGSECPAGNICDVNSMTCGLAQTCNDQGDCHGGQVCNGGKCENQKCTETEGQCTFGSICDTTLGYCVPVDKPKVGCTNDASCLSGMYCNRNKNPPMCEYITPYDASGATMATAGGLFSGFTSDPAEPGSSIETNYVVWNMTAEQFYTFASGLLRTYAPLEGDYRDDQMKQLLESINMLPVNNNPNLNYFQWDAIPIGTKLGLNSAVRGASLRFALQGAVYKKQNGTITNWAGFGQDMTGGESGQQFTGPSRYLVRALAAAIGLGLNGPKTAMYYTCQKDSSINFPPGNNKMDGSKSDYSITFQGNSCISNQKAPPVESFWSITVYDKNGYPIENANNIFSFGTHSGIVYDKDGGFTLYLTKEETKQDYMYNWLPIPASEFNVTFRGYVPKKSLIEQSWIPPFVDPLTICDEATVKATYSNTFDNPDVYDRASCIKSLNENEKPNAWQDINCQSMKDVIQYCPGYEQNTDTDFASQRILMGRFPAPNSELLQYANDATAHINDETAAPMTKKQINEQNKSLEKSREARLNAMANSGDKSNPATTTGGGLFSAKRKNPMTGPVVQTVGYRN